jgi:hypothetical protein
MMLQNTREAPSVRCSGSLSDKEVLKGSMMKATNHRFSRVQRAATLAVAGIASVALLAGCASGGAPEEAADSVTTVDFWGWVPGL